MVLDQLQCSGMLDTLSLMHDGYPTRSAYRDLSRTYKSMMPKILQGLPDREFVEGLLMALDIDPEQFQLGLTRVFLKAGQLAFIDRLKNESHTLGPEVARYSYMVA